MPTNPVRTRFSVTIIDAHKFYKKRCAERGETPIDYKKYKIIIKQFFTSVMTKLIMENYHFLLPYGLGIIGIKAYKLSVDSLSVDMAKSVKYKKVIKYINDHTWNYSFGFNWNTHKRIFRNRIFYKFSVAVEYKKMLADRIFELANDPKKRSFIRT